MNCLPEARGAESKFELRLLVPRLVKEDFEVSWHLEADREPEARVGDIPDELDPSSLQLRHGLLDVIAVKGNVMGAGWRAMLGIRRMAAHLRLGDVEDKPAVSNVGGGKTELVPDEGPQGLGLRGVKHRVNALDHWISLFCIVYSSTPSRFHGFKLF